MGYMCARGRMDVFGRCMHVCITFILSILFRVHIEGLQKNLRKFVWLGGTMLYTNLVFQSFPTLRSARIASQIHPVLLH